MALEDVQVSSVDAAVRALVAPAIDAPPAPPHEAEADQTPPRLAEGVELIGEFEGSGFKTPPFIVRRGDGQVVQMPQLLYQVAEHIDGDATIEQIARRLSHAIRRDVQATDVRMLIDERLRPLGIVAKAPDGESIELDKIDPLMALKFRAAVVPERAVRSLTSIFWPLFHPAVVILAVAAMLGLDGWLFFEHGVAQSVRHVLYQPALMLLLIGGVILATAFHEVGHATACRYGGAKPGVMGVGIYIVWPAFYTDITDAYRLGRWGRVRADVGGMYFNAIFALIIGGLYAITSFEALLLLIVLQNFAILQQSLPLLRLDGYYILSDLTGVPDIFLRIGAVLRSLIPGRPVDPRVNELKSWVRFIVSAYVLLIVVFLLVSVLALVLNLPRIIATGYDSAALHYQGIGPDFTHGQDAKAALDLIEMVFLILPAAGLAYTITRIGRRTITGASSWSAGHPRRQLVLGIGGATAVVLLALSWWPNGTYRALQPGQRGTLSGLVKQIAALPTGSPAPAGDRVPTNDRQQQPTQLQSERHQAARVIAGPRSNSAGHTANPAPTAHQAAATSTTTASTGTTSSPDGAATPPAAAPPSTTTTTTPSASTTTTTPTSTATTTTTTTPSDTTTTQTTTSP